MSRNRRIEVGISRTVNLGNYNSMKCDVRLSCDISDDADLKGEYDKLWKEVELELTHEIIDFKKLINEEKKDKPRPWGV